ncbi:hypothetical protein [Nocardioides sp. GY 10127]|uniref:hypothetical protein n=1 Tax=Nocardioides sp. GY 10127 TaxID=2569762 RepID=UPI0010A76677|nr:hypothetical protein [Nocardioides sp. GY 10127]TIC82722.1 hypothetical protein E8D37_08500 [Nocardioides sp. GY 10127]
MTGRPSERPPSPGEARAWGWLAHLRDGGTTAWSSWSGTAEPGARVLPGAQHLELVRRLNLQARTDVGPTARPDPALVERVLAASPPGRGRPELDLVGVVPDRGWGLAPVDPTLLPRPELVRLASVLLAEDVLAAGGGRDASPVQPPPRRRLARRRPSVAGDPWLVDAARTQVHAAGHRLGHPDAGVLVLGADLATMIADTWTARAFACRGRLTGWEAWVRQLPERDLLPRGADPVGTAHARTALRAGLAGRVSDPDTRGVNVVLDPALLPGLLRVRSLDAPPAVPADAVELARRVSATLALRVPQERGRHLMRTVFLGRVAGLPGPPLGVPAELHRWVHRRSQRLRRELADSRYPVHGRPGRLVSGPVALARRESAEPDEGGVLATALRLLTGTERSATGPAAGSATAPHSDPHRPLDPHHPHGLQGGTPR